MGIRRPRKQVIGIVLAGEIESIGPLIRRFNPGDRVYGVTGFELGCYAEYTCLKEKDSMRGCLAAMPATLTFEEATAAAYGGLLALQYMEKGNVQRGQNVLIYGASGTCGTLAIQLARLSGAVVTGVCSSSNLEMVKALGADRVIDYTREDSTASLERYDFVLDAVGRTKNSRLKERCRMSLTPTGRYASIDDGNLLLDSGRLSTLKDLIESGKVKPVLDRIYPLDRIVEAHRYVDGGHKKGGVAISIR